MQCTIHSRRRAQQHLHELIAPIRSLIFRLRAISTDARNGDAGFYYGVWSAYSVELRRCRASEISCATHESSSAIAKPIEE